MVGNNLGLETTNITILREIGFCIFSYYLWRYEKYLCHKTVNGIIVKANFYYSVVMVIPITHPCAFITKLNKGSFYSIEDNDI